MRAPLETHFTAIKAARDQVRILQASISYGNDWLLPHVERLSGAPLPLPEACAASDKAMLDTLSLRASVAKNMATLKQHVLQSGVIEATFERLASVTKNHHVINKIFNQLVLSVDASGSPRTFLRGVLHTYIAELAELSLWAEAFDPSRSLVAASPTMEHAVQFGDFEGTALITPQFCGFKPSGACCPTYSFALIGPILVGRGYCDRGTQGMFPYLSRDELESAWEAIGGKSLVGIPVPLS